MPAEGIVSMAAQGATDMVVVITGGDPVEPAHLADLPPDAVVVAADSGVDHALALGLRIDHAVGDFDSASPEGVAAARDGGAAVHRHPTAKDATDLELALDLALTCGPRRIHVLGGHGGRLDHLLANALLLAAPALRGVAVTAQMGAARLTVVRGAAQLRGAVGDLVTLLPAHGPARGVTTAGLLFPLAGEDLLPGSTRGVSNELVRDTADVDLTSGVLVAIQPGQRGPHHQETRR